MDKRKIKISFLQKFLKTKYDFYSRRISEQRLFVVNKDSNK